MATGPGVNQGKTSFVREYLADHREADVEAVNRAWGAAGNEGSISESLVSKLRSKLGLTGKRADSKSEPGDGAPKGSQSRAAKRGRKPGRTPGPVGQAPPRANGSRAPEGAGAASRHDDDDVLDELEEGLDDLIQRLRDLGGRPDVVKSLRRARRLLVRSHEG